MLFLFKNKKDGLTLFEVLIAVLIVTGLFLIVFWALNPVKQLAGARNAQRIADADTILKAVYQYSIDHEGNFPGNIDDEEREICQTGNYFCYDGVDLSDLTNKKIYIYKIPVDPRVKTVDKTGYTIRREYDRIVVRSIYSENEKVIEVFK